MKKFTAKKLASCNGENGRPAYVAYDGKVYDVSSSFLWKDGNHQAFHTAGTDLTPTLKDAPHGAELLEKFPVVGIMRTRYGQDITLVSQQQKDQSK
jgi:predicted heme/steroid binding protein